MQSILGIGECMVELSPQGSGLLAQGYAGDVLNTLWYARAALGSDWNVEFHSGFGVDPVSQSMKTFIQSAGISCDGSPSISDRVPGLYMIHLDGAERSFSYWRDTSAARKMMQDPELLWAQVRNADLIYLSGITLAVLPAKDVKILISELRNHLKPGALIALDPNIRPRLWDDAERMLSTITEAAKISDIILPSFDDETASFGDATPTETAHRYQELGASMVVVKNGESPTLVLNRGVFSDHPVAPTSGVIDTTAAGDSFNGAFLAELLKTEDVANAVAAAQNCAARVVCTKGALVPFDQLGASAVT